MNQQQFTTFFNNSLQDLAKKQLTDNTNKYHDLVRDYTALVALSVLYKNYVLQDSNLFENVKCLLKYNHKYINDVNLWRQMF